MHSIYKTEGLVLASRGVGEANKIYDILTKDLGLIRATAQGVRNQGSKLRPHLGEFSASEVAFVRGKTGWRVTDANLRVNYHLQLMMDKEKSTVAARIFSLLRRL